MKLIRNLLAIAGFLGASTIASAGYSGLYIFGDSLSDPGNVALTAGAVPGQIITGNSYIPSRPYGSNQFSNGDVWAKTFAGLLGLGSFGTSFQTGGGNFAFGGARVAAAGESPSLTTQEGSFFLGATGGVAPPGALYVIAGGGNDARDALAAAAAAAAGMGDPTPIILAAAAAYAQNIGVIVDSLQGAGAQHIVVWDVPNLGLAPAVRAAGPAVSFLGSLVAQSMNSALSLRLASESGVALFDIFGLQNSFAANPAAFGLTNVTDACGAPGACDPSTGLFWDGIHPTAAGHALLAQAMLVTAVPEPAEYLLMLGGLVLIARRVARRSRAR